MFGADRTELGYLENPQQRSIRNLQEPVAVLAFLCSPHLKFGMKQYECGHTQPLVHNLYFVMVGKLTIET